MPKGVHNNHPKREAHGRWKGGMRVYRGYVWLRLPEHHRESSGGYVKRAILVLEEKLGRPLTDEEEPHHKDENKMNDDPDNLEVLTHSEHAKLHFTQYRKAGRLLRPRKSETRKCVMCGVDITRHPSQFRVPVERTTCDITCKNRLFAVNRS